MKRKSLTLLLVLALCVSMTVMFTGCGKAYNYDLSKYVTVGDYTGLEYDAIKVSVSDKEIKDEINSRLESAAKSVQSTSGTVKDGDTINIDYVGKVDGKEFDKGSDKGASLTIGSGKFIDGFEDGLIGKKVGTTVDLNLTFPDPYENNEDLSGKDVVFTVTINSKTVKEVPEYNLDFVKANSESKTLEEYEKSVKQDLYDSKYEDSLYEVKNSLWQQVVTTSEVKSHPEKELKLKVKDLTAKYQKNAESYGVTWEEYLKQSNMTEEDFQKQVEEYAKTVVGQEMMMYYIADKEGIELTDKEYDKYLADMLEQAGLTEDTFEKTYGETIEEYANENDWRTGLLLDKVLEKVMELGKEKK